MDYTRDWPRACTFAPYIRNQAIESFCVFIDISVADDICFFLYDDHCQNCPLDDIAFYYGWLAYGLRLMYPHLFEWVMRKFGFFLDYSKTYLHVCSFDNLP